MILSSLSGEFSFIDIITGIIASLAVIFIMLPVHEFAHAYVAKKLGDNTAEFQGRLTLNPFAHIDYFGAAALIFVGIGWANPVPVNMNRFRNPKRDMAITALAGPVSNLIMSILALLLQNLFMLISFKANITVLSNILGFISSCLVYFAMINISLMLFNFIPLPPLDGSRLLSALLPDRYYYKLMRYERYSVYIVFALILVLDRTGIWSAVLETVFYAIFRLTFLPFQFLF